MHIAQCTELHDRVTVGILGRFLYFANNFRFGLIRDVKFDHVGIALFHRVMLAHAIGLSAAAKI